MSDVIVAAHFKDEVSAGYKQMASNVQSTTREAAAATQNFGTTSGAAAEQIRRNTQALTVARAAIQDYKNQTDPAKVVTEQNAQAIQHMGRELGLTTEQAKRFAAGIVEDANAGVKLDESLRRTTGQLAAHRREQAGATAGLNAFGVTQAGVTSLITQFLGRIGAAVIAYRVYNDVLLGGAKAAIEAETAQLRLQRVLEVTGKGSAATAQYIGEWASSLADLSGISDEAISNMASTAIALGQNEAQARKLAEAAVILHNRLGLDLDSSFQQLLQTLDGSAGRFAKLIPGMQELTAEQLKAGAAADVVAKALGTAEADGLAGALARVKNALDEDREHFGQMLIKATGGTDELTHRVNLLADSINALNTIKLPGWVDKILGLGKTGPLDQITSLVGGLQDVAQQTPAAPQPFVGPEAPPGFETLQHRAARLDAALAAHEHDPDEIFKAYRKAFNFETASKLTEQAIDSNRKLSDIQDGLAKDIKARSDAEQKATKAATDLAARVESASKDRPQIGQVGKPLQRADLSEFGFGETETSATRDKAMAKQLGEDAAALQQASLQIDRLARAALSLSDATGLTLEQSFAKLADQLSETGKAADKGALAIAKATADRYQQQQAQEKELQKAVQSVERDQQRATRTANILGDSISRALIDGITHARSFGDIVKQIFDEILHSLTQDAGSLIGGILKNAFVGFITAGPVGAAAGAGSAVGGVAGGNYGEAGINVGVGALTNEIRNLRNELRHTAPEITQAQLTKAVATVLIPDIDRAKVRGYR